MVHEAPKQGGDLFIVDNSDQDWKVRRYLLIGLISPRVSISPPAISR